MTPFDIPKTPWELVARQRDIVRRLFNREYDLSNPVMEIGWPYQFDSAIGTIHDFDYFTEASRRVNDPEFDVLCQLEAVRHQIECLKASAEVGHVLANVPAFDMIHFGTGPLATAFGSKMILREGAQPAFEPAVHTPEEAMRLKKPDLFRDGICPKILERIRYYNRATRGEVLLTPCDTAGPWSVATSIWHYEDMLEAIHTAPEAVHYLLDLVTESMIEWINIQETFMGRWGRNHGAFSFPCLPRGIAIGDDCLVAVSPAIWEAFFMPYNNRLSREYGGLITYHCCMRYEGHFESIAKTDGFIAFDAKTSHNDFEKIAATLERHRAIWTCPCEPGDMDYIRRLAGKAGMLFSVKGRDRADAICQTRDFLAALREIG
ncbi:MAG: uroporphyrinogen decarboxylase family protein [Candidatus Latescibacterota bacterium]